jgi:hypothetical protein
MRKSLLVSFLLVATLVAGCAAPGTGMNEVDDPATLDAYRAGVALAVQGDVRGALARLEPLPADKLDAKRRRLVSGVIDRFAHGNPPPLPPDLDPWTAHLVSVYRRYWTRVMMGTVSTQAGADELLRSLRDLTGLDSNQAPDMDSVEIHLKREVERRGLHALFGETTPLREFMLWRKQTDVAYPVELPEGPIQVSVAMLDDFISYGWVGYATAEVHHIGGWTTPERLYCVGSSYDLDSESFQVSYLAHEGQHFYDAKHYPKLEQPELEYRSKLVEIALAEKTLPDLLEDFDANQSESREQPHPFANRRLMRDLAAALAPPAAPPNGAWWKGIAPEAFHAQARRLLAADNQALDAQTAAN